MQENFIKIKFSDVRLSTVWYDNTFNINAANKVEFAENEPSKAHFHISYEAFFVTQGKLWLITESDRILCENSIIIIPPNVNHYTVTENAVISIMDFVVEKRSEETKSEVYDNFIKKTSGSPILLPIDDDIAHLISRISREQSSSPSNYVLPHLVSLLFSDIFRRIVPPKKLPTKSSPKYYSNQISNFMSKHYKQKITLTDIASALFLSEKQTSRIIHKEYGCSFNEFITRWRLNVACMYLNHTSLEICEIASLVGYEYTSLFFTHFKKTYGITPTAYRKNINSN